MEPVPTIHIVLPSGEEVLVTCWPDGPTADWKSNDAELDAPVWEPLDIYRVSDWPDNEKEK